MSINILCRGFKGRGDLCPSLYVSQSVESQEKAGGESWDSIKPALDNIHFTKLDMKQVPPCRQNQVTQMA